MYVCMYVIYVCMLFICMLVRIIYTHKHTHITYICLFMCVSLYVHVCIHVCMHVCVFAWTYMCIHNVSLCTHIHNVTHTYMHAFEIADVQLLLYLAIESCARG